MSAGHARLGPSGAHRWLNCHGSVFAESKHPDETSEYAAEGSAAHTVAEECLKEGKEAKELVGTVIEADGFEFTVDAEMAGHVQQYVDYCRGVKCDEAMIETVVDYSHLIFGGEKAYGTADFLGFTDRVMTVVDFKYGKGVEVRAEGNPQMRLYALGALSEYEFMYPDIGKIRMVVHQPRLGNVDVALMDHRELVEWGRDIVTPASKAIAGLTTEPERTPGDWCQFCRARADCPARLKLLDEPQFDAASEFEALDEPVGDIVSTAHLTHLLPKLPAIEALCKDLRDTALQRILAGEDVPGWKAVESRSNRAWADAGKAETALRNCKDIKARDMYTKKLVGPPGAEKVLGRDHPLLKKHVVKPPGKPTLAPAEDRRPPLNTSDFDSLEA